MSSPPQSPGSPDRPRFELDGDADTGPVNLGWSTPAETFAASTQLWGAPEENPATQVWTPGEGQVAPAETPATQLWDAPEETPATQLWGSPEETPATQVWTSGESHVPAAAETPATQMWGASGESQVPPPPDGHRQPPPPRVPTQVAPAQAVEDDHANRYSPPLTVDPRATDVKNSGFQPVTAALIAGIVVLVAALVFVVIQIFDKPDSDTAESPPPSTTAATASPADQQKLQGLLPQGYAADSCKPAELPKGALAKVTCSANSDPGGPLSASYTLAPDAAALKASFDGIVGAAKVVNCPGNIQSPGPWRRNATPNQIAGTLFCGLRGDTPTLAWTNDAGLMLATIDGAKSGPNLDKLYAWWSGHS